MAEGIACEGGILSKSIDLLFRAVRASLCLPLAMTELGGKTARHTLMQGHGITELGS